MVQHTIITTTLLEKAHSVVILAFIQQTFVEYLLSARSCRQKMNKVHNVENSEGDKHVRKKKPQRKSIKI